VEQYTHKGMSFIVIFLISIVLLGIFLVLFKYLSANKIDLDDSSDDEFIEIPLREIFLDFDHDSTKAWLKWIDAQDESKKQLAYDKLVEYLELPPSKLGVITSDVVKAIIVFRSKVDAFDVLANLIVKCRKHYKQFKTIDLFYEIATTGLVKIDQVKAKKFLADELNNMSLNSDLEELQKYMVRAIAQLDFTHEVESIWSNILISNEFSSKSRKEFLDLLDAKSSFIKERIYSKFLEVIIPSRVLGLAESEKMIYEPVLYKCINLLNSDGESNHLWSLISKACDNEVLQEITSKVLSSLITTDQDLILPEYLVELLSKPEPLRTTFMHTCMNKYKILESEKSALKVSVKESDLVFEYLKINIEKSKKTKSVTQELLGKYQELEKAIKSSDGGFEKKSATAIAFFGSALEEKLYLLRAYAANSNRSFVYIDIEQLLSADGIVKELKNHISQVKPCIVYIDNLGAVLGRDLEKKYSQNLKSILKTVKELAIVPSMDFIGGFSISLQDLDKFSSLALANLAINVSTVNRLELNKLSKEEKEVILRQSLTKIDPKRIEENEDFSLDEVISYFANFDLLDMLRFWNKYLEISLCAYGRLVSLNEFKKYQPENLETENDTQEDAGYEAFEDCDLGGEEIVFENAKI
jgi:hypothetical protein